MVLENNLLYRQHFHQHLLLLISLQLVHSADVMLPHEEVFYLTVKIKIPMTILIFTVVIL